MSGAVSDMRRAVRHRLNRTRAYSLYKSMVLEDREAIAKWVVDKLVRRYKADVKRTGLDVSLPDWLAEHSTLHETYVSKGVGGFSEPTRRHWAMWQVELLIEGSMRLFEDGSTSLATETKVVELLGELLNAKHDEQGRLIDVRVVRLGPYSLPNSSKAQPATTSLAFAVRQQLSL